MKLASKQTEPWKEEGDDTSLETDMLHVNLEDTSASSHSACAISGSDIGASSETIIQPACNTLVDAVELSGVKTVVIEDQDLIIQNDITYADADASWAFIVKNGNIRIDSNVTSIAGAFVTVCNT